MRKSTFDIEQRTDKDRKLNGENSERQQKIRETMIGIRLVRLFQDLLGAQQSTTDNEPINDIFRHDCRRDDKVKRGTIFLTLFFLLQFC